jgi:transglutaminase-like putative cysteine protease
VKTGYLPNPDATLASGTGICFDYAALAADMLRSQGIPSQLITGYVGQEELYHAWNRFYVKEQGWITAEIQAKGKDWKRVDITFASEGVSDDRLEDDSSYTPRNTY